MTRMFLRIFTVLALFGFGALPALSQATLTPNVGFQIPAYQMTNWQVPIDFNFNKLDTMLGGSASLQRGTPAPTLGAFTNFVTANTTPEAITNFVGGFPGQTIRVICGAGDTSTSLATGSTMNLSGPWSCPSGVSIGLTLIGTVWTETARYGNISLPNADPAVLIVGSFPGADTGAQLNNCDQALPGAGGTCVLSGNLKPLGAPEISTALSFDRSVVVTGCAVTILQDVNFPLAFAGFGVVGCPGNTLFFQKNANIDQFTLSAANTVVANLGMDGAKGTFTGSGIVTASGASNALIQANAVNNEASRDVYDNSGTFSVNHITGNFLFSWGLHGFESTSSSQQSIFSENYMAGDGTATGSAILNGGSDRLVGNYVKDSAAFATADDSTGGQAHQVTGNTFSHSNGYTPLKVGPASAATANAVTMLNGGSHGPAIDATLGGAVTANVVAAFNADGIDGGNGATIEANTVALIMSGVSGKCGVSLVGDVIGFRSVHNQISLSDSAADTNYGVCDQPTGTHNLNVVFDGDNVTTTLSGGATAYGFFMNNAAGLNANWSATVANLACVHLTACVKRTDAQNNVTLYRDIQQGDTTVDAGTGSTNDIWVWENRKVTFASLPSPAGDGSHGYCTNCSQAKPTTSAGSGALAYHEAGQWNGL